MWRDLTKFQLFTSTRIQLEFPFYWQWKWEPSVGDDHSSWRSVVGPPVLNHPWPYWCNVEVKSSSGLSIYMPQKISHLLGVRLGGWKTHIQLCLTSTLSSWWKLELSVGDICTLQDLLLANLYWGAYDFTGIIHWQVIEWTVVSAFMLTLWITVDKGNKKQTWYNGNQSEFELLINLGK